MTEKILTARKDEFDELAASTGEDYPVVEERGTLSTLRYFWRRRNLIAKVTLVGFVLSLVTAFLIPKTYKSTVQLMPPDSQSPAGIAMLAALSGGGGAGSLGTMASDLLGLKSSGALFVGVLRSRSVQDAIIDKFDLRKVYRVKYMEQARKKLATNTSISEDRKSGIIRIDVTDRDPVRASQIAQTYASELDRIVTTLSISAARKERIFLGNRLKGVEEDLNSAAKEFSQFSSKNSTLDIKEQAKTMVEAASILQGQLIAAEAELNGMRTIYTDNNVRVKATEARIQQLRNELKKLGGTSNPSFQSQDEPEMVNGVPTIRQLPLLGVQYADLYRRVKVQETVYEVLTKQYELAKVQEAKEVPTVKLLDEADVPERKSGPPRLVLAILGTLIAFGGCCFWLSLNMAFDRLDPNDGRKILISEIANQGQHRARGFINRFRGVRRGSGANTTDSV